MFGLHAAQLGPAERRRGDGAGAARQGGVQQEAPWTGGRAQGRRKHQPVPREFRWAAVGIHAGTLLKHARFCAAQFPAWNLGEWNFLPLLRDPGALKRRGAVGQCLWRDVCCDLLSCCFLSELLSSHPKREALS